MLGIIGGSGFYSAGYTENLRHIEVVTEYSDVAVPIELVETEKPLRSWRVTGKSTISRLMKLTIVQT